MSNRFMQFSALKAGSCHWLNYVDGLINSSFLFVPQFAGKCYSTLSNNKEGLVHLIFLFHFIIYYYHYFKSYLARTLLSSIHS